MNKLSLTGIGVIIMLVQTVLQLIGIETEPGTVEYAVNSLFAVIGFVALVWGQLRRRDLVAGIVRKQNL
jgi:uncharacterized membrane protein